MPNGEAGGYKKILAHKWFADIDMQNILGKKVASPFKPELIGDIKDRWITGNEDMSASVIPKARMDIIKFHEQSFAAYDEKEKRPTGQFGGGAVTSGSKKPGFAKKDFGKKFG